MSQKGSGFERLICKKLSNWWIPGRDDIFWRTNASGAMAKIRSKKGKGTFGQYGDVQATDPIGQDLIDLLTIELKRGYKGASVADVLDKGTKAATQRWELFLDQVLTDRDNASTPYWLLITQRDRREAVCFFPLGLYKRISAIDPSVNKITPFFSIHALGRKFVGMKLDSFLSVFTKKIAVKILKNYRRLSSE